ncbi:uncharacterized protein LOC127463888 [Manacus candei]|uniref:uncharacterized protein LOC127463888 n=1 Tax=Manacus candei TaxID=415023 RepID=UPI002227E43A|nr:uncharacterized protein LOC127463888 [Manacus candei]
MVGRAGLCIAPSGCVEMYILKFQMLSLTLCWLEALPSGTAGTPGAAWADGLDAPAPPFLPSHWGRVQWWHCQPCSGMEPGKCTELSPGIERDQAREVKKEGRREVRQQASSTKLLCKQFGVYRGIITPVSSKVPTEVAAAVVPVVWASGIPRKWPRTEPVRITPKPESLLCPSVPAWLFVALQAEEPRPEMAECWCDPQWVSLPSGQSPELPLASPAEGWELPRASSIQLEDPGGCSSCCLGGENLESGQEEEKPRDSSLSPRQPMNCLAGNGGMGWTLDCSLGMCGTAGTPGAAWADGLDAPAPPFLPSHWGRVQWWHCQPCSGMEPGKCTELSPGM